MERDGGFDVVVGNPPWERIKLQEQEFFAARSPAIASAPNKAERQKLIDAWRRPTPTARMADCGGISSSPSARRKQRANLLALQAAIRLQAGATSTPMLFSRSCFRASRAARSGRSHRANRYRDRLHHSQFFGHLLKADKRQSWSAFMTFRRAGFKGTDDRLSHSA